MLLIEKVAITAAIVYVTTVAVSVYKGDDKEPENLCYALSQIGYDSVINSNVGVPIEESLEALEVESELLNKTIKQIVITAYSLEIDASTYQMLIMNECQLAEKNIL